MSECAIELRTQPLRLAKGSVEPPAERLLPALAVVEAVGCFVALPRFLIQLSFGMGKAPPKTLHLARQDSV